MKKFLFLLLFSVNTLFAQEFVPRAEYNALLEPKGQVINGVGQSQDAHRNYWNVMLENQKPSVIMTYVGLRGISSNWSVSLKNEILSYQPNFLIPQIGLSMTIDGTPSAHYEGDVAAGKMDADIEALIEGLRTLASPAYLRIGYEFNGLAWNGYQATTYKQAFIRITEKIRAAGLEVATVWDAAVGGTSNYMDFYPGDSVVDWCGINVFTVPDFSNSILPNFLTYANQHNKPVMIGESTPTHVGVLQGETSWTKWFAPYFKLIRANSGLKMFCYINWNWASYAQWADWGDARLEMNSFVAGHYNDELKAGEYLHATSEHLFRSKLGYNDTTAPTEIKNLRLAESSSPSIEWDAVTDASGLSHYIIYDSNGIVSYTLEPKFSLNNLFAGQSAEFRVTAVDRAGNESKSSGFLTVKMPREIQKTINGDFENKLNDWNTDVWGGAATFSTEELLPLSGAKSAHIMITESSGTDWHIQLRQWMQIKKGFTYRISYKASANKNLNMKTWVQMDHTPFGVHSNNVAALTTIAETFTHQFVAGTDDAVYLEFVLGSVGLAEVWIDDVSIVEVNPNVTAVSELQSNASRYSLEQNYPNPFKSITSLAFHLPASEFVRLKVFNLSGAEVASLVNRQLLAGNHEVEWNAAGIPEGIYFYQIQAGTYSETKKLVVAR